MVTPTTPTQGEMRQPDEFTIAEARAEAWSDRVEIQHMVDVTSSAFAKWASPELLSRFRQQMMAVIQQAFIEGYAAAPSAPVVGREEIDPRLTEWGYSTTDEAITHLGQLLEDQAAFDGLASPDKMEKGHD